MLLPPPPQLGGEGAEDEGGTVGAAAAAAAATATAATAAAAVHTSICCTRTRTITGDTLTSAATISIYLYPTYNYIHNIHENDNHIFSLLLTLVQPNLAINNW